MPQPHAVCIPAPFQSHIKAMLKLAKLLHHRGFHTTFVNTDFNHRRFLKSQGPNSLDGLPHFRFETIPDGLPDSNEDCSQEVNLLGECVVKRKFLPPFRDLLVRLNRKTGSSSNPPVSCIVSDGFMSPFTVAAAEEFELPIALFYTIAACSLMGFKHYPTLVEKGLAPLKDESCLTNEYLDKIAIDWIPGIKNIHLRDLPTFFRTTNPNDTMFNLSMLSTDGVLHKASAIVVLTFDALEQPVLTALSSMHNIAPLYTIGPIELLLKSHLPKDPLDNVVGYSLWKEETECFQWLDCKPPNSVVYVNFGSIIVMTPEKLVEFCWGLANSKVSFFWVVRPDLVSGKSFPPEFVAETKERGLISSWCPQEQVLNHPSVGGFLTHCGWNSTIESLSSGVPMLCWPFFADQQTDCFYACHEWGIGMEIDNDVRRDEVEKVIKELMEGEKGKKMRNKALEWKKLAEDATAPFGSSSINFDNLVNQLRKL